MAKSDTIPNAVIGRLSLYLRQLEALLAASRGTVSSKELGAMLGQSDAQVRKDLAYFGQFGQAGVGYGVEDLVQSIRRILGTDRTWNVLLVGAGNLGRALVSYRGFLRKGFSLNAVVDADPNKVGELIDSARGIRVQAMEEMGAAVREHHITLAILAVPVSATQEVADQVVAAGIKGVLNFAPTALQLPDSVPLTAVDLSVSLEQLSFQLSSDA